MRTHIIPSRPELAQGYSWQVGMSYKDALSLVLRAVAKRRSLVHGQLDAPDGKHCAMGAFWADNPGAVVSKSLVDEITVVNDALSAKSSPKRRWKVVLAWLRRREREISK